MDQGMKDCITLVKVMVCFCVICVSVSQVQSVSAKEAPPISSSLAKNLWRQAHAYYEEGMDAKATRACKEMLAWAEENNEPAIAAEMKTMLADLEARKKPVANTEVPRPAVAKKSVPSHLPDCGFGSKDQIPMHFALQAIGMQSDDFLECSTDSDCIMAQSFCGSQMSVSKSTQECFEAAARAFEKASSCGEQVDPPPATSVCRNQRCTIKF